MIPPAAERFLGSHTRTFLMSVRPDGAPACHPMVGVWRDGALYLNTYRKSAKVRTSEKPAPLVKRASEARKRAHLRPTKSAATGPLKITR